MSNNNDFRKIYEESEKQFLENAVEQEEQSTTHKTEAKSLFGFILGFVIFIFIALGFLYLGTLIQQ